MRQWTVLGLVALVLVMGGCQTQERSVGEPTYGFDTKPGYTTIAVSKIYRDDTHVGFIERVRVHDDDHDDSNDRHTMFVKDVHERNAGWIHDDGRAYRVRAWDGQFSGADVVARATTMDSDDDLTTSILAIFDWPDGKIRLEQQ